VPEPEPAQPVAQAEAPAPAAPAEPQPADPVGGFTPPPSSLEDLAAASRSTRFSIRNRSRDS
jgi:hypothetical protein